MPPLNQSVPSRPVQSSGASTEDLRFINEMSAAGLLGELHGEELSRIAAVLNAAVLNREEDPGKRQLDLLVAYYDAERDRGASERRRRADRFFLLADEDALSAPNIVARLAQLHPELGYDVILERIGGAEGPLVIRAGEQVVGVVDEYEESLDTGEIDLRDLEAETITLRGIMVAMNILLERFGTRHRMVPLLSDDTREAYIGAARDGIIELYRAGFLDFEDRAELDDHCTFDKHS